MKNIILSLLASFAFLATSYPIVASATDKAKAAKVVKAKAKPKAKAKKK